MSTDPDQHPAPSADSDGILFTAALRRLFNNAPCFLPALSVLGVALGDCWWGLSVLAFVFACMAKLWRVAMGCLLCAAIAQSCYMLHERSAQDILSCLDREGAVTVQGTVVQRLSRGGIVRDGWSGASVAVYGDAPLECGDVVEVTGTPREISRPLVPGMFDASGWMRGAGICAQLDLVDCRVMGHPLSWASLRGSSHHVRAKLERLLMPEESAGDPRRQVLCALVLGDKDGADPSTMLPFRRGGCLHAFAVSGLHVGVVAGVMLLLLGFVFTPPRVAHWLLLAGVGVYVWMTGMSVSAMRAYLMLAVLLGGRLLIRPVGLLNVWCFAGLALLLFEPWQVFQSGFQLSFVVYAAIYLGLRVFMKDAPWFGPDPYLPYRARSDADLVWRDIELAVRSAVLVPFIAWVGSLPLTYAHFHAFSIYGVLTNLAIIPILPVVMVAGFLCICFSASPVLCWVADAFAVKAAGVLISVVSFFAGLPASYLPACMPRASQEGLVLQLRYGNSVCLLGNPGLLIDCGTEQDVNYTVQPLLFHDGFSPAALLQTRPVSSRTGGGFLLQTHWRDMAVVQVPPGNISTLETSAGGFHIYGAPADIATSPSANVCPVVTWHSPHGLVVYVGDASLATLESVPEELSGAVCVILGFNKGQMVDADTVMQLMPGAEVVLLPSAVEAGVSPADFAPLPVSTPTEQEPLLRLECGRRVP